MLHGVAAIWNDPLRGLPILAFLVALVAGQLLRFDVFRTSVKSGPVLPIDLAVLLLWLTSLFHVSLRPRRLRADRVSALVALFVLWALMGNIRTAAQHGLSASQVLFSSAYLARWLFYFGAYIWVKATFYDVGGVNALVSGLRTAILVFSCFGILQSALLPNFAFLVYPEALPYTIWDIQGRRLVATFLDPNFAGDFIGMGLLLALPETVVRGGKPSVRFVVMLVALFLTASRGAVVGVVVGTPVVLFAMGRGALRRTMLKVLLVGLCAIALSVAVAIVMSPRALIQIPLGFLRTYNKLTLTDPSALTRLAAWAKNIEILTSSPVFGIGFNTLGFVQQRFGLQRTGNAAFGLDGGLLFIAALTGVVGAVVYLAIALVPCLRGWALARNPELPLWVRHLGASVPGTTVLAFVHGFFVNSLLYPLLAVTLWILWGAVIQASKYPNTWPVYRSSR